MRQTPSITLLDGRIIPCYESKSSEQPVSNHFLIEKTDTRIRIGRLSCPEQAKAATPESTYTETNKEAQRKLFLTYFHTFYSHRERILSDSRMFLARIPMHNGLAFTGMSGLLFPTLGVLIEWLLHAPNATEQDADGRIWMVCRIAGSPLSGNNHCTLVDGDGNTRSQSIYPFISLWSPFMRINHRYEDAKSKYQSYTLKEVVDIFSREGLLRPDPNEITILHLNNQVARLRQQIQEADKHDRTRNADFHQALMRRHFDQLCPMVRELEQRLSDSEQRLTRIYALRADLRHRLRNKELLPRDYQQQLASLNRECTEILRFCRNPSTTHICDTLFNGEYISFKEMRNFITNNHKTEQNKKWTNFVRTVKSILCGNSNSSKKVYR